MRSARFGPPALASQANLDRNNRGHPLSYLGVTSIVFKSSKVLNYWFEEEVFMKLEDVYTKNYIIFVG